MTRFDLEARVPGASVPSPEWIAPRDFNAQLARVHGASPDPRIGLYGPDSMMWRIGRHTSVVGVAAGRALLLQIAHPWITVGIDRHSLTRDDPLGRAHRTFTNVLSMNFGSLAQAFESARRVYFRHAKVQGVMDYGAGGFESGTRYRANEANAMLWVHATLWESLMMAYELVVDEVSDEDKERYYQETKLFAYLFGIPDEALPPDWPTFVAYCDRVANSSLLAVTPKTKALAGFLFHPMHPALVPAMKAIEILTAGMLPQRIREDFELPFGRLERAEFAALIAAIRAADRLLPPKLRYTPTYFEAKARIAGRKPSPLTRVMTRAALGQWELVG